MVVSNADWYLHKSHLVNCPKPYKPKELLILETRNFSFAAAEELGTCFMELPKMVKYNEGSVGETWGIR